jgi:hypothetical protein
MLSPQQILLKNLLIKRFAKTRNKQENKRILIGCIETHGYISAPEQPPEISEEQQILDDFMAWSSGSDSDEQVDFSTLHQHALRQSLQSQQQSSFLSPGTFIQGIGPGVQRLQELNQRGISSREQEYLKINEIFEAALKEYPNPEELKRVALDIYAEIDQAYVDGRIKGALKATAKKGFLFLAAHYALVNGGIYVSRNELVHRFGGLIKIQDIPGSEKKLKKAFNKVSSRLYKLINNTLQETSLCGMRPELSEQQVFQINTALSSLKTTRKIQEIPTVSQLAAVIHIYGKVPLTILSRKIGVDMDTLRLETGRIS